MSKHTSIHDPPITDRPFPTLSSPVRTIAFDAVPPRDRSLPATLCTIAGALGATEPEATTEPGTPGTERVLEPVANAVTILEGYVRIRQALLESDRYTRPERRDAAILASDHLHAAAYATLSESPVSEHRSLELFRVVAAGSSSLATRFAAWAEANEADEADHPDPYPHPQPTATLAGIAAALGATAVGATNETRTAVGATNETRTAMETYAQSLSAALSARASGSDGDPRETAVHVLSGRADETVPTDPVDGDDIDTDDPAQDAATDDARERSSATDRADRIDRHLERARESLATLEDLTREPVPGNPTTETGTESDDRSPLDRLERATRLPFRND